MNKKMMTLGLTVILLTSLITGCVERPEETLVISGSTSVAPVSELLGERFMELYPRVRVDVHSIGSTAGIVGAYEGINDIGMSSRYLRGDELGFGLDTTVIARDAIVAIVHPDNPVDELTTEQLRMIYAGEITNWMEVGGPDAPITAITREEGSGTRGAFEDMVMDDDPIYAGIITLPGAGGVRAGVVGNPDAIAYISLWGVDETVRAIKIDGVMPTVDTVLAGDFEIARPYLLVTLGEPDELERKFLDFVLSEEGQEIVKGIGLVPIR